MQNSFENKTFDCIDLVADIVSAYVSNNPLRPADLGELIASVHQALENLGASPNSAADQVEKATPAQVKKSIMPGGLISFLDGKSYKTLKRHLGTHGLDPHTYRARFGLPSDYPMVSSDYAAQRSALAKSIGLGRIRVEASEETEPKRRGRPSKVA